MLDTELDNQESLNPEGDQDTNLENEDDDTQDEAKKAKEYGENQKIRAEKAEKEAKELKAELAKKGEETPKNDDKKKQSNEPDYAKEAFLEQRGIKHADDKKLVYDEATRLKLPLTDVLGMEHISAKLKDAQTQREAEDGMPDSKGKPGSGNKGSEEYWLNKKNKDGSYAVPKDPELHRKIINKRMKVEEAGSMFDPIR